ncbi:MAG: hypothetical protein KAS47_08205, partial [Candidatus Heimdallarchaeota archaeon]|nr:hypothetical protein [Candidatus Heimdallarchaeota archaeon]
VSKNSSNSESPSKKISSRKRKIVKKNMFVELEEIAYEALNISKRKLKSGQYLKDFLDQTSSQESVLEAIKVTIDALLDSIASDLDSLSAAALVPHPESKDPKAIVRGPLKRDVVKQILAIFRKYPPVINDLLGSDDELKVLDTGIGYVVLENCQKDNYLVGIVKKQKDVDELSRKLRHVQNVVVDNTLLLDGL